MPVEIKVRDEYQNPEMIPLRPEPDLILCVRGELGEFGTIISRPMTYESVAFALRRLADEIDERAKL